MTTTSAPQGEPPRLYVNSVRGTGGPYDVILDLGFQVQAGDAVTETVAQVVMSWEHAKSLVPLLEGLIAHFESQVSEIPTIPGRLQAAEVDQ